MTSFLFFFSNKAYFLFVSVCVVCEHLHMYRVYIYMYGICACLWYVCIYVCVVCVYLCAFSSMYMCVHVCGVCSCVYCMCACVCAHLFPFILRPVPRGSPHLELRWALITDRDKHPGLGSPQRRDKDILAHTASLLMSLFSEASDLKHTLHGFVHPSLFYAFSEDSDPDHPTLTQAWQLVSI